MLKRNETRLKRILVLGFLSISLLQVSCLKAKRIPVQKPTKPVIEFIICEEDKEACANAYLGLSEAEAKKLAIYILELERQ